MPSYLKRLSKWMLIVPVVAVGAAGAGWPVYKHLTRPVSAAPDPGAAGQAAVEVQVARVVRRDLIDRAVLPGSVEAIFLTPIYAKASGYLDNIAVDRGDWVYATNIIGVIGVPEIERDLLSADAEIAHARILAEEAQQAVAEAKLTRREAELAAAESKNLAEAAEIGVRGAKAAVAEADGAVAAAHADAHVRRTDSKRIADLFAGNSATAQERDQAEGKRLAAEAAVMLAEAKLVGARLGVEAAQSKQRTAAGQVETAAARLALAGEKVVTAEGRVRAAAAKVAIAESARARVAVGKENATIHAPFDGVVTTRHADPGAMIQNAAVSRSAEPIVTLAAMDRIRVEVDISEAHVKNVVVGSRCTLETDSHPGRKFEGEIVRTAKALDPKTRTMPAEAEFANPRGGTKEKPDFALYPGMYGRLTLELGTQKDALVVPAAALAIENRLPVVYVLRDGRIRKIPVKLGLDDGVTVQIRDTPALKDGDRVVIGDKGGLADGKPAVEAAAHGK